MISNYATPYSGAVSLERGRQVVHTLRSRVAEANALEDLVERERLLRFAHQSQDGYLERFQISLEEAGERRDASSVAAWNTTLGEFIAAGNALVQALEHLQRDKGE